jgi:hypothetical protein
MVSNLCFNYLPIKYSFIIASSSEPLHESENTIIHALNVVKVTLYYFPRSFLHEILHSYPDLYELGNHRYIASATKLN